MISKYNIHNSKIRPIGEDTAEHEMMIDYSFSSVDSFVADIKSKLANATPLEVAPEVVQPIKDLMKGMTAKKSKEFKKAIATAMRNADIKLPSPSPSDDYTEN